MFTRIFKKTLLLLRQNFKVYAYSQFNFKFPGSEQQFLPITQPGFFLDNNPPHRVLCPVCYYITRNTRTHFPLLALLIHRLVQ